MRSRFLVETRNAEIIVNGNDKIIRIVLIIPQSLNIGQQVYNDTNLQQLTGSTAFKNIQEFYLFLSQARTTVERWMAVDHLSLQITSQHYAIRLPLTPVTDTAEIAKTALMRASLGGGGGDTGSMQQEIASLKSGYNTVGAKLKGIGELFEGLHQTSDQNTRLISELNRKMTAIDAKFSELQVTIRDHEQRTEQSIYSLRSSIEILEKTMHRNNQTLNQNIEKVNKDAQQQIQLIWADIQKYDFMRIRRDNQQILKLFDLEIKVRDHSFVPDQVLIQKNRNLHWLNKRILKNLEDVRDYNKAIGEHFLSPGISKMRILVHNIKNNGLLFGICTGKVKEGFESTPFNDTNMITLNSCGYVTNRGAMTMLNSAKVKAGDTLKLQVNMSQGRVSWFCNDMEVGVADMGPLNKEEVYVVIGLGFFGDEVEVLECQLPKKTLDVAHETYAKELERMNEKYGSRRRH